MSGAQFTDGSKARTFILAGDARFTIVSGRTGTRFTFRVEKAKGDGDNRHFVSVLTGANNDGDYTYLGTIFQYARFNHGKKSRIASDSASARAFMWAWGYLMHAQLPPNCEVWHEGRCGRCGRALTVPESIATGLGPVCAEGGA